MYDPKSKAAEDFINHDEIESTLMQKNIRPTVRSLKH